MAIDFNKLFARLGKIAHVLAVTNAQEAQQPVEANNVLFDYTDNITVEALIAGIDAATDAAATNTPLLSFLQQTAQDTLNYMVNLDNPLLNPNNLNASLIELIRQMVANNQQVLNSSISNTTTAGSNNNGDGNVVFSSLRGDGSSNQNILPEDVTVACTQDSTSNSSLAGTELFSITGQPSVDTLSYLYPGGSGASVSSNAIDATQDNAGGNLLTNSDFEDWTLTVPDHWTVVSGGSRIQKSTTHYSGTYSLEFLGNGSTDSVITQEFDNSSLTAGSIDGLTIYAINFHYKLSATTSTGSINISLIDGSGTTIFSESGGTLNTSLNLTTVADTNWHVFNYVFTTPYILPDTIKLKIEFVHLDNTKNLFVDHLAFGVATTLYTGGPSFAVFSGVDNFYVPDYFTVAVANDMDMENFQPFFDRMFSMKSQNLLLPSTQEPSISNKYITVQPLEGLQAYWNCDEASNQPRFDASGNGFTLDGTTVSAVNGVIDAAAFIGDDGNNMSNASFTVPGNNDSWSVQLWFYRHTTNGIIFRKGIDAASNAIRVETGTNVIHLGPPSDQLNHAFTLNDDAWHHFVGMYDADQGVAYIALDGNLVEVGPKTWTVGTGTTLYVGASFVGYVDLIGLWNRVLTQTEINALYNAGDGITYPWETF